MFDLLDTILVITVAIIVWKCHQSFSGSGPAIFDPAWENTTGDQLFSEPWRVSMKN